ncbi:MAG: YkoP family protein [Anaerolineae bacterium]|jgi:hypothetical protein
MRTLIRAFDRFLCQRYGVFEFDDGLDCILRLQTPRAAHPVCLDDGTLVQRGDPVLMLHFWNERMPPIGPDGADLVWAIRFQRMLLASLRSTARWLAAQPDLAGVRAVGAVTVLVGLDDERGGLLGRLGMQPMPRRNALGSFGEFWENFYSWALMWAYNPASLHHRHLLTMRQREFWISAEAFEARYGPASVRTLVRHSQ